MGKIYKGFAYELNRLIETPDCQVLILEIPYRGDWKEEKEHRRELDLGRRRILLVNEECYLVVIPKKGDAVGIHRLSFLEGATEKKNQVLKIMDVLKDQGIRAKLVAEVRKKMGWTVRSWRDVLVSYAAIVSEAGLALQQKYWLDGWNYHFRMQILKKNWLTIGGIERRYFDAEYLFYTDIMERAGKYIETALAHRIGISFEEFRTILEETELQGCFDVGENEDGSVPG